MTMFAVTANLTPDSSVSDAPTVACAVSAGLSPDSSCVSNMMLVRLTLAPNFVPVTPQKRPMVPSAATPSYFVALPKIKFPIGR